MKNLYCPWRTSYSQDLSKQKQEKSDTHSCVFCSQPLEDTDEKHFIVHRGVHNYVMLNLYPYNAGHMLIIPFAHQSSLAQMSPEGRAELIELTSHSIEVCKKALKCEGLNTGMNLGKVAGAGIPAHLHMHVLPRWAGDTNFLPLIGETKQISFDLREVYQKIKDAW
jgi:ATP adenylyltransferase